MRSLPSALPVIFAVIAAIGCSAEAKKSRLLSRANSCFDAGDYEKAKIEYLNVLKGDPQNAAAIQRLGNIWYQEGAPARAAPFLLKTRELVPEDLDSRMRLAAVFLAAGQFEEARKEALAVLERSPAHEEAVLLLVETSRSPQELQEAEQRLRSVNASDKAGFHLALAALSLRKQDLASAMSAVKQAISLDPHSVEAHAAMAKLYWLTNDLSAADREFKVAAELASTRSPVRLTYAEFKFRTGAPDQAKAHLSDITREAPDSLPAWRLLAQIAFREKQLDESLKYLENILFRDPADVEARLLQAQVWLAQGEVKKAIEGLENLDTSYPKAPSIKYQLARAYLQDKNPSQASLVLSKALAENPDYVDAILLLAEINLRNGRAQQVVTSMLDLLKERPNLLQAQVLLAQAYQSLGRLDDAAAIFRDQIKANPQIVPAHLSLGLVLRQQGKLDEAQEAFDNAQRLAPENLAALSQLVDLDIQRRNFDDALRRIRAELQRTPQSAAAHFLEGKIHAAQSQWDLAETSLLRSIELQPESSVAYDLLIATYVAANKLPQAISQLETLLSRNPDDARALMLSALIYQKTNAFSKAAAAYEKVLSAKPDFPLVLNNLAYLYAERLDKLEKAYELAQKARSLQPGDAAIADTLGWILYKRGDYKQALGLLQESAQSLPTNPEIQFHYGMANYAMGRTDEARTALRQAVAAPADFPGKEEATRRLSLLGDAGSKETQPSSNEVRHKEQSDDPLAQFRLGESYEKQGEFAKAAAASENAIKLNPNLLSATAKLAQLYAGPLQDYEKALKFARKARELAPNDPKVLAILGKTAYQAGNFSWAYSLLQESARRLPEDGIVLYDFAWSAYSLGKVSEARQAMQRVLATAPDASQSSDAKLFLEMTALAEKGADPVAAQPRVEEVLKANPDYIPALMAQAAFLLQRGESEAAATAYSEILHRAPDFVAAQKRLASLYAGDPEKREQAYSLVMKARKALPDDPELAQILAGLSYERKDYAYALQLLQECAKKGPLGAESLYYLGMSHWQVKEQAQGEDALQRALAAGLKEPLSTDAKRVLAELRESH